MNALVTRRALLGATASLGAFALPAVAETAIPVLVPIDPDAGLLDLIARHGSIVEVRNAHADVHDAADRRFREAMPPRPDALTETWATLMACGTGAGREVRPDGRQRSFYTLDDVERVRASGPATERAWDDDGQPLPPIPSPEGEVRRLRVIAASDAWEAEKRAVADRVGLTAAEEEDGRLYEAVWEARDAIRNMAPATLAGLRAKARWAMGLDDSEEEAAVLVQQIAEFGGVAS